jgi:hypothetical protein
MSGNATTRPKWLSRRIPRQRVWNLPVAGRRRYQAEVALAGFVLFASKANLSS